MLRRLLPLLLVLLIAPFTLTAQDDEHPPQFLYRDGDHLVLVTITSGTSDASTLPSITVGNNDQLRWSPDGRSVLTLIAPDGDSFPYCLNLYDVDRGHWVYETPIACGVTEARFAHDSSTIAYALDTGDNGQLWLYNLENESSELVAETTDGYQYMPAYVAAVRWSPTDRYLLWDQLMTMAGGGRSTLYVRDQSNDFTYTVTVGLIGYYASYTPIWSPDENWFLLRLQEEYIHTNHQGDVYLIHASTGEQYRLTYTPAEEETNIRWSNDGHIGFDIVRSVYLRVEDAINIPEPTYISQPESILNTEYEMNLREYGYPSPYPGLEGWVRRTAISPEESSFEFEIHHGTELLFSTPLPINYRDANTIIGWRPAVTAGAE